MKKSSLIEEQVAFALHWFETGTSADEGFRKVGISQGTFYAWRKNLAV